MAIPIDDIFVYIEGDLKDFLVPDNTLGVADLESYEKGGVDVNDPSEGINSYNWVFTYSNPNIFVTRLDEGIPKLVIEAPNAISLSGCFDQNMRPAVAWEDNLGDSYFYWFDIVTNSYKTTQLPANSVSPKFTTDAKSRYFTILNMNDALLFYARGTGIYYRSQRERYNTEHKIATATAGTRVGNVGMSSGRRIKVELVDGDFVSSP